MLQRPSIAEVHDLLRQIHDRLLDCPPWEGAVKIVLQSEEGEQVHVVKLNKHCSSSSRAQPSLTSRPPPPPRPSYTWAESLSGLEDDDDDVGPQQLQLQQQERLIQQCEEQRRRIAELETRLQQVQEDLRQQRAQTDSDAESSSGDQSSLLSPTSTSGASHLISSSEDTNVDGDRTRTASMAPAEGTDVGGDSTSSSSPEPNVSSDTQRRSKRWKSTVDRWQPSTHCEVRHSPARHGPTRPSSSNIVKKKKRGTKRFHRAEHDDSDEGMSEASMEIDSVDGDGDAMEVATLVAKLREAYNKTPGIALDSLTKDSILSLQQQVLKAEGNDGRMVSAQISALISTSTSLKMIGYYFRAILVHRLKETSKSYQRLARDTLCIKSTADIAAYSALFDFIQYHYPTLAMSGIEVWLVNPTFLADITWTEWKRYLSKQGRPIIDAALRQFHAEIAPFQDWMQLGWVEIYEDEKMHGKGVRAIRDIHLPTIKGKQAQRDLTASISMVAADLHCADPELMGAKDSRGDINPAYFLQLDQQRVFDARHHWIGKINHLPMPHCNLKLTANGKLVQIKPIAAGDSLIFDYGIDYWVYQVTGLDASEWLSEGGTQCQRGRTDLFNRMHDLILDYSGLLRKSWAKSLSSSSTAVEREDVLVELEDAMSAVGTRKVAKADGVYSM